MELPKPFNKQDSQLAKNKLGRLLSNWNRDKTRSGNDFIEIANNEMRYYESSLSKNYEFSSHGLEVHNVFKNSNTIDFSPEYVVDILELPESERLKFKINSVKNLIRGLNELIKFIKSNPNTLLGKVTSFEGSTNEYMANLVANRLNIQSKKTYSPRYKTDLYHIKFKIEDITQALDRLRAKNPKLAKELDL
jgi:hypothetical protein